MVSVPTYAKISVRIQVQKGQNQGQIKQIPEKEGYKLAGVKIF